MCFVLSIYVCGLIMSLDNDVPMFSLEEDDCSSLFITQTPSNNCSQMDVSKDVDYSDVLGLDTSENTSVVFAVNVIKGAKYSDISDPEDDFVNPIYGRTER